jgi:hypothetical protein
MQLTVFTAAKTTKRAVLCTRSFRPDAVRLYVRNHCYASKKEELPRLRAQVA